MKGTAILGFAGLLLLAGCHSSSSSQANPGITGGLCDEPQVKQDVLRLTQYNYLWNDRLPAVDLGLWANAETLLSVLTEPARDAGLDKNFSYLASLSAVNAFYGNAENTGYGVSLLPRSNGIFINQVLPNSAGSGAGLGRGDQVLAVADSQDRLGAPENQASVLLASGTAASALSAGVAGTSRWLRVRPNASDQLRDVNLTSATYSLDPVPNASAPIVLQDDNGHRVGYLMLRVFTPPAEPLLRTAMGQFRQAGVTDLIIDLRYNGGGTVTTADLLLDLLRRNFAPQDIKYKILFNANRSRSNSTAYFRPEPNAIAPGRIAFIVSAASASCSEAVPNELSPYFGANLALVGDRTYGKPVGQELFSNSSCDWVLGLVTFEARNGLDQGGYYQGLPYDGFGGVSIAAADDLGHAPGDPAEACTAAALRWIGNGGQTGNPIPAAAPVHGFTTRALHPQPTLAQRHMPGLF